MKYLQPSFSVYPSVKPRSLLDLLKRGEPKKIDPNHEYTEVGGMCLHCALDRRGHQAKYEANKER